MRDLPVPTWPLADLNRRRADVFGPPSKGAARVVALLGSSGATGLVRAFKHVFKAPIGHAASAAEKGRPAS